MNSTSISHDRALKLLLAHPADADRLGPWIKELPAIITHWLQIGRKPTPFVNKKLSDTWNSLLAALAASDAEGFNRRLLEQTEISAPRFTVHYGSTPFPPIDKPKFKFIDLFAGIGGFRIAMQELGGKCVFTSEWDNSARETYFTNFGEIPFGDIKQFTNEDVTDKAIDSWIPDHDVLCAGFPCQPFSRAGVSARMAIGKNHGFACEAQGTLFFDIVRIARVKRPAVLFLENVRNLKSHDGGRTFRVVKETIENDLGYSFNPGFLDSSGLVPQKRERVYMVCFRDKKKFGFPLTLGSPLPLKSILEPTPSDHYTISDRLWVGHKNRTQRNLDRGAGFTAFAADLEKPANTLVARYGKDGKECLIPQEGKNPRKLTRRECARLQGFPEQYVLPGSDAAAYRQFGNSVAVPVIRLIAKSIIEKIL